MKIEKFSPCKINLTLAITGVRNDGFHDLISLVAQTKFGDTLSIETSENDNDKLICNQEGVPTDESNLVMKAAKLFREHSNINKFFNFNLQKNVPAGAGLGGGSSNAAVALNALNEMFNYPLDKKTIHSIAATLGSDCPLFLTDNPVIMSGRGEQIYELTGEPKEYIQKLKLMIFKPSFSINTAWAYSQMRANPTCYIDKDFAQNKLSEWLENPSINGLPLLNNMQSVAFEKFPALELCIEDIKQKFKIPAMMSGSGSACFAILNKLPENKIPELLELIKNNLGPSTTIFWRF